MWNIGDNPGAGETQGNPHSKHRVSSPIISLCRRIFGSDKRILVRSFSENVLTVFCASESESILGAFKIIQSESKILLFVRILFLVLINQYLCEFWYCYNHTRYTLSLDIYVLAQIWEVVVEGNWFVFLMSDDWCYVWCCDMSMVITLSPGPWSWHWPAADTSSDLNTGLWLADICHVTWILPSYWTDISSALTSGGGLHLSHEDAGKWPNISQTRDSCWEIEVSILFYECYTWCQTHQRNV